MKAFTNTKYTKQQAMELMREHRRLDLIVQGEYGKYVGDNWKGCFVGCAAKGKHSDFEHLFGVPWHLAWLADDIFEGLENDDAQDFAEIFFDEIKEGADLSRVYDKWCAWMLGDKVYGLVSISDSKNVVNMAELFGRASIGDEPRRDEFESAARYALSAITTRDERDPWNARDIRAAMAAWNARNTMDACPARAARDAMAAWNASATRNAMDAMAAWNSLAKKQRDKLLELMAEAI